MNRHRVLIIEDDPLIRSTLSHVLEFEGFSVHTAENGAEGLKSLSCSPDIILLDRHMPVMDGEEFLKIWRNSEHNQIPLLMLSAASDQDLKNITVNKLRKPFDIDELLDAITLSLRGPSSGSNSVLLQ